LRTETSCEPERLLCHKVDEFTSRDSLVAGRCSVDIHSGPAHDSDSKCRELVAHVLRVFAERTLNAFDFFSGKCFGTDFREMEAVPTQFRTSSELGLRHAQARALLANPRINHTLATLVVERVLTHDVFWVRTATTKQPNRIKWLEPV
jgi:hypothetical protein